MPGLAIFNHRVVTFSARALSGIIPGGSWQPDPIELGKHCRHEAARIKLGVLGGLPRGRAEEDQARDEYFFDYRGCRTTDHGSTDHGV